MLTFSAPPSVTLPVTAMVPGEVPTVISNVPPGAARFPETARVPPLLTIFPAVRFKFPVIVPTPAMDRFERLTSNV